MAASQPDLRASAQALLDNPDFHSAIIEQAKILGMDPAKDKKYLHLAAESLVVGSGQHWTKLWDEQNHHEYWHNHTTGESAWLHPVDEEYRAKFAAAQLQSAAAVEAAAAATARPAAAAAPAPAPEPVPAQSEPDEEVHVTVEEILTQPNFRSALLNVADLLGIDWQHHEEHLAIAAECLSQNQSEPEGWQTGIDPGSGHQYWWNDTTCFR